MAVASLNTRGGIVTKGNVMSDELERLHAAAHHASMVLTRLSGEDGLLDQISRGEWDDRFDDSGTGEHPALLDVIAERARLDRIVLELMSLTS